MRRQQITGARVFAALMGAIAWWATGNALELNSPTLELKRMFGALQYVGVVAVPPLWFWFAVRFTEGRAMLTTFRRRLLWIEPIVVLVVIALKPGWFWRHVELDLSGILPLLKIEYGVMFWVHTVYAYILLASSLLLLIQAFLQKQSLYRQQITLLLMGSILPMLANVVYVLQVGTIRNLDLTPVSFAISGVFLASGIFQFHLLDLMPVAFPAIIEQLSIGMIIVNQEQRVVEVNPSAALLLGLPDTHLVGQKLRHLHSERQEIVDQILFKLDNRLERATTIQTLDYPPRFYEIKVSRLRQIGEESEHHLIVLNEISHILRTEQALRVAQERLSKALETSPLGVVIISFDTHRILYFNQQFSELTGWQADSLTQARLEDLHLFESDTLKVIFRASVDGNAVVTAFESRLFNMQRHVRYVRLNATLETIDELPAIICQIEDITEAHQAQQRLQALAEQRRHLLNVSHSILSARSVPTALAAAQKALQSVLLYDTFAFYRLDSNALKLISMFTPFRDNSQSQMAVTWAETGLLNQIMAQKQSKILNNIHNTAPEESEPHGAIHLMGFPILLQAMQGILVVARYLKAEFNEDELEITQLLVNYVIPAIENILLLEDVQKRVDESEMLRQAGAAATATLKQDEVIARVLESLGKVITFDTALVFLLRQGRAYVIDGTPTTIVEQAKDQAYLLPEYTPLAQVMEQRKPVIFTHLAENQPELLLEPSRATQAWLGVPLMLHDQVQGFLTLESKKIAAFSEDDARLTDAFGGYLSIAIQNAQLYQEQQQQLREMNALQRATATLLKTLDLNDLLNDILESALSALPNAQRSSILLLDPEQRQLTLKAEAGALHCSPRCAYPRDSAHAAKAIYSRTPILINDLHAGRGDGIFSPIGDNNRRHSAMLAPLRLGNEVFGVISLDSTIADAFSQSDLLLLMTFAGTATAAIRNARLHAEVQKLAITDALTGLYNRRGFFEMGKRETERARRFGHPLTAVMIDIDNFKHINDTYGHDTGDLFLAFLGRTCKQHIRDIDIAGRYGGEEFALLLPETTPQAAFYLAERLRQTIQKNVIETVYGGLSVTISIGMSAAQEELPSFEELLQQADQALYYAKRNGKNRSIIYHPNWRNPAVQQDDAV